jgi:FlaA1/EpsC-like NDP-sugar epimerase
VAELASRIRILIVGAGHAGRSVLAGIAGDPASPFEVAGFIDDDSEKLGSSVLGVSVLGSIAELRTIIEDRGIDELFIAIPSERGKAIRRIVESTFGLKIVYKILPRLSEVLLLADDADLVKYIRRVKAEDLLGGEILKADQQEIADYAAGQTILITGAAGSIGSELSRQIAAYGAARVVFYDWWENGMFDLRNQLLEEYPDGNFEFVIGDIKDRRKLSSVVGDLLPTTIFHAAAYKHVPLMEDNPAEAIKNNIVGTKTLAEIAIRYRVAKFVLVSSDKAVRPTNIMGATKRAAEKVLHILSESQSHTIFCAVRFGNVVNSNGSAIPTFERQIDKGGPVTVTHRDVTRYFMTIPEAVHLILQSWVMGQNNDLFVLDMADPIRIYELARLLIALHGYEPERDIQIDIIGLRPGEKLYEEVLVDEEGTQATAVRKIFRTKNYLNFDKLAFLHNLNLLIEALEDGEVDKKDLRQRLQVMVSTYHPAPLA